MSQYVKTRYLEDTNLALGANPNNLTTLRRLGIPMPDQVTFSPAAVYYTRGDGTRVGDGYASAQWVWDTIALQDLSMIMEFLGGADWSRLYVRTDKRDALKPNPRSALAVYYGIMLKPILSGQEGVPLARSPYALQTVAIQFNVLEATPAYL